MPEDQPLLPWPEEPEEQPEQPAAETVLTVSDVNRLARRALENIQVTVQGEISRLSTGYAYFVYFDLRDSEASLPAVLTQQQARALDFKLEEGASVVVRGTLSLYERQGKYQVRVADIRPFGEGELRRRIEALKRKLAGEGLFDDSRKLLLPDFPERIGVVTSPRGAAVRDVIVTLGRRFPPARVFLRGVTVQGTTAVGNICDALDFFDGEWPVDVVILARGGGSLADLEPFNSEEVARAIARMKVPVISGIGHEPDVTIADLVADRRASTPTGAAEAAVPDRAEVTDMLARSGMLMARRVSGHVTNGRSRLTGAQRRPLFRGSQFLLGPFMQRLERGAADLPESPRRGLARGMHRLAVVASRPVFQRRAALLADAARELDAKRILLQQSAVRLVERRSHAMERAGARLTALSPLAVLERGYSITFNRQTGAVVRSPEEVSPGTALNIRLARGELDAEVKGKE